MLILDAVGGEEDWSRTPEPRGAILFPSPSLSCDVASPWKQVGIVKEVETSNEANSEWLTGASTQSSNTLRKELGGLSCIKLFFIQEPSEFWRTRAFARGKEKIKASKSPKG